MFSPRQHAFIEIDVLIAVHDDDRGVKFAATAVLHNKSSAKTNMWLLNVPIMALQIELSYSMQ